MVGWPRWWTYERVREEAGMENMAGCLLDGKTAIVTGAGSGVGRGIAIALGRAAARVAVSSRTVSKCETVVAEIEATGGQAVAIECDVTRPEHIDACVARTIDAYGAIDIL